MQASLMANEEILIGPATTSRINELTLGKICITNMRIIFEGDVYDNNCNIPLHQILNMNYEPGGWISAATFTITLTNNNTEVFTADWAKSNLIEYLTKVRENYILDKAKRHEKLLEFEEAAKMYKIAGYDNQVIRVRKKARNKVKQTIVHGDYVDDRDTIVKDSVINRSNIGFGEKSKAEEIKDIKELLDSGAIDDDEFKQMKQEILGK
mgnify:CR=1 FL=1